MLSKVNKAASSPRPCKDSRKRGERSAAEGGNRFDPGEGAKLLMLKVFFSTFYFIKLSPV